tara:strand:- start:7101 stop:8261 length:1161 start_codon:yes stop_codon:yes gene_type:complete
MKLGLFLPPDVPETGGGFTFREELAANVVRLVAEFSRGEHQAVLLRLSGKRGERLLSDKLKAMSAAIARRLRPGKKVLSLLEHQIDCSEVDVVWFIDSHFHETDLPYFLTVFDLQHRLQPWFPEVSRNGVWGYREEFYASAIKRASYVVSGSIQGSEEVKTFYCVPEFRSHVIPLPTPASALSGGFKYQGDIRPYYGLTGKYFYYPAQIWPHKNHRTLLSAWKLLKDELGSKCPMLVLSGAEKGYQSNISKVIDDMELANLCKYIGFVEAEEVYGLLSQAEGLVFPTLFGPDNIPPLEAMALKTPVIVSDLSGCRQMYGDAAIYVDSLSPEDIARGVRFVMELSSGEREELITSGFEYAKSCTINTYIEGMVQLLDRFEPYKRCWG